MERISEQDLKILVDKLKSSPEDLDLINSIAIGYFENPTLSSNDIDLAHFELAYNTKKTVKSTHNLAWFLYFEIGQKERALAIQRECINLKPKSFYPYCQYGYMLMQKKEYHESIKYYSLANNKLNRRNVDHNIGYCNFNIGYFEEAKDFFNKACTKDDLENRSLYNLALTEWKLKNSEKVKSIADKLSKTIQKNIHQFISGYEIGLLYFLLGDIQKTSKCLLKQGVNAIDLFDWQEMSYSLWQTDKELWAKQIKDSIDKRLKWIEEIQNNHEDWSFYNNEEKQKRLIELNQEVQRRLNAIQFGLNKPRPEIEGNLSYEDCGCLLFDCKQHGNLKDDE